MLKTADTHVHLNSEEYQEDWQQLVTECSENGINALIVPGTDAASSQRAAEMSRICANILPAGGIHPHDCETMSAETLNIIKDLLPSLIAVGEIGLDYHYDFNPRSLQIECFEENIELARKGGLPIIIHARESDEDIIGVLKNSGIPEKGGVVHCCSSPWEYVKKYLDMGLYIGITGMVTFPKGTEMQEAAVKCPLDRLLTETDGPYLAPVPHRGKRCRSVWMLDTIKKIALLRRTEFTNVYQQTAENACSLFGERLEKLLRKP